MRSLTLTALAGVPEILRGADLPALIEAALQRSGVQPQAGDALVLAQKIVSKAEGRQVDLRTVTPSAEALRLAPITGKDARYVEVVLRESRTVLRAVPGVLVVEDVRGFVTANAGIDQSNVPGDEQVLLLPLAPQRSAERLRAALRERTGVDQAVIINDSFGRAWRNGVVGIALGVSGLPALADLRGQTDRDGRALRTTQVALADELAAAGSLVMGQAAEGTPVVHVRGLPHYGSDGSIDDLLRLADKDLFR